MNAVFQSFSIGSNVWLAKWSNDNEASKNLTLENGTLVHGTVDTDMYLGVYGALGLGQGKSIQSSFIALLGT